MAKTPHSRTDDPAHLGKLTGCRMEINEACSCASAAFVVANTGNIMTMPGVPKVPVAAGVAVKPDGEIVGVS